MDSFMMSPLRRSRNATPDIQEESPLRHPDAHHDDDIYRGRLLPVHVPEGHDADQVSTLSTSISSSTASASAHVVRRALATIVELAILRWARSSSSNGSDSSSSSSVHSGRSRRRHPRRPSISTSVVDTTYIALAREAAERARRVTRGFYLVLPVFQLHDNAESPYRTLQTPTLSLALAQLNTTLRQAHRARRDLMPRYPRAPAQLSAVQVPSSGAQGSDSSIGAPGFRIDTPMKRGRPNPRSKQTAAVLRPSIGITSLQTGKFMMGKKAWWLDVASPTWDDMRAIGTVNLNILNTFPLQLMINLHSSFAVSSSTPSHTRGCPTPRPTRETRVVPETWLLSYSISCYRCTIGPRRAWRSTGNRRAKCDKRVSRSVSRRNLFCQLHYNPTWVFVGLIYLSVSSIFPISPNM